MRNLFATDTRGRQIRFVLLRDDLLSDKQKQDKRWAFIQIHRLPAFGKREQMLYFKRQPEVKSKCEGKKEQTTIVLIERKIKIN